MQLGECVESCLADLNGRIIPRVEQDLAAQWERFLDGDVGEGFWVPGRARAAEGPSVAWPDVSVNDAQRDVDAMVLHQFTACSGRIMCEGGQALAVRCNYGVGILPSLFGAEIRLMDKTQGNLPTSIPMGPERCRQLLDKGVPDIHGSLGGNVFRAAARFRELMARYPVVAEHVALYHPDLQGPMDVVELLWGSDLFTAVYLEPDTIHALLNLVTDTYIAFMREWERIVPPTGSATSVHWALRHRGRLMLRDDSAMNFPPELFDEFIRPHDQRILNEFDGGVVHFCGRGDHYIASLCTMDHLFGVNMSQPELNDMERIYTATIDARIPLLGFSRSAAEHARDAGRELRGMVQCF